MDCADQQPTVTSAPAVPAGRAGARRAGARRRPRWALAAAGWISWMLAPAFSPAGAQYISPGTAAPTNEMPSKESFVTSHSEARWSVGGLRLDPWLGISDARFVDSTGLGEVSGVDGEEDFTVTAGAGLRAYLKAGPKIFWTAHLLPEYVWWQDSEQKRRLNSTWGLGVFGYFNRLTLEVSQRRIEEQDFFSAEIQELTSTRRDHSRLALVLELGSRLELFASGQLLDFENLEQEASTFLLLDRQEESLELGVRYRTPAGLWAELAFEDRAHDFAAGARNLSNSGTSERLGLGLESPKLNFRLDLAADSFDPGPGSEFRPADETTGGLELLWLPSRRLDLLAYTRRDLSFSVDSASSHFLSQRQGLRLNLQYRVGQLGLFGELGEDEFEPLIGAPQRLDDVTVWGVELNVELGRLAFLKLLASRTEYDSNLDGFDREVTTAGLTIELGGLIERLSLGAPGGEW